MASLPVSAHTSPPPRSSPSSLHHLPAELLDGICFQLRPIHLVARRYPLRPDYSALYSLCLTSRRLLSAALPHLYSSLVLGPPTEGLAAHLEASDDVVDAVSSSLRHLHVHPFASIHAAAAAEQGDTADDHRRRGLPRLFTTDAAEHLESLTLQLSGDDIAESLVRPLDQLQGISPVAPRRIFIKHSGSRLTNNLGQLQPLTKLMSNLTHMHLSGASVATALLYPPTLDTFAGPTGKGSNMLRYVAPNLTHLRLSLLPPDSLGLFQDFVSLRAEMDSNGFDLTPQDARYKRGNGRVNEAKSVLFDVAYEVGRLERFRCLSLELSPLMRLDEPTWAEDLRTRRAPGLWAAASTGMATGSGPIDAPFIEETLGGQLVSMDFPSDVIIDGSSAWQAAAAELEREAERNRTAWRDDYWMTVRNGREALRGIVAEGVRRRRQGESGEESIAKAKGRANGHRSGARQEEAELELEGIEVRLCTPRSSGWNLHEVEREHWANVRAVEGIPPLPLQPLSFVGDSEVKGASLDLLDDLPCYEDEDLFLLAERDEHFGYEEVRPSFSGPARWWWTGEFPRVNAGT